MKRTVDLFSLNVLRFHPPAINQCYENDFRALSDRYYKTEAWPAAEDIGDLVDQDKAFLLLYKEVVFRHLFAKFSPTVAQRIESWKNYCELFESLIGK